MAVYVMADIHGEYDKFIEVLDRINLSDTDTLYVLGDVLDRGPKPIKVLLKLMSMPNAICIVGNHEWMAIRCLDFLMQEITDASIEGIDDKLMGLIEWQENGSASTIEEFRKLDPEIRQDVLDYIEDFLPKIFLLLQGIHLLRTLRAIPGQAVFSGIITILP